MGAKKLGVQCSSRGGMNSGPSKIGILGSAFTGVLFNWGLEVLVLAA